MSMGNATWRELMLLDSAKESWRLHLTSAAGDTLRLSDTSGNDGAHPIYASVTSWGEIRREISLKDFTAKTTNTSVTLSNDYVAGTRLFDLLKPTSASKWINWPATIYSVVNGNEASKSEVFTGHLVSVRRTAGGDVVLGLEPRSPFDFIQLPSVANKAGIPFPVVYGLFTPNSSTIDSPAYCTSMALWPAPVEEFGKTHIRALSHVEAVAADARPHIWEESLQQFVPVTDADAAWDDASHARGPGQIIQASSTVHMGVKGKANFRDASDNDFADGGNAVDYPREDDTFLTSATATVVGNPFSGVTATLPFDFPLLVSAWYGSKTITVYVFYDWSTSNVDQTIDLTLYAGASVIGSPDSLPVSGSGFATVTWTVGGGTSVSLTSVVATVVAGTVDVGIVDVRVSGTARLLPDDDQTANNALKQVDNLFCGADGLEKSWDAGTPVSTIAHLHRDLMYRFAGYTTTPENWSALDSKRSTWSVRWWQLKARKLTECLERAQFEGAFIFDWSPAGVGRYLFPLETYSALDLAATLVDGIDTTRAERGHTQLSDLLTKQVTKYQRHPADESRFLAETTQVDSGVRANWNIQTDENVETVELEMLAEEADTRAAIVAQLRGDLRETLSFDAIRPRALHLAAGDVVQPSGEATYHMVTTEGRRPNRLRIETEEVGA